MSRALRQSIEYAYVAEVVRVVAELTGREPGWGHDVTVMDSGDNRTEAPGDITVRVADVKAIEKAYGPSGLDGVSGWELQETAWELSDATFRIAQQAVALADGPASGADAELQLGLADMWVHHNKGPLMDKVPRSELLPDVWTQDEIRWDWRAKETLPVLYNVADYTLERSGRPDRFSLEAAQQVRSEVVDRLLQAGPEQRYDEIANILVEVHDGGDNVSQMRLGELAAEFRTNLARSLAGDVDRSPTMVLGDLMDQARDAASDCLPEARRQGVPMHVLDGQHSSADQAPAGKPTAPVESAAWKPPTSRGGERTY